MERNEEAVGPASANRTAGRDTKSLPTIEAVRAKMAQQLTPAVLATLTSNTAEDPYFSGHIGRPFVRC